MSEPKGALQHALDLFVYAPVGLALAAREDLGGVVEKGRREVAQQVRTARIVGELAVTRGRTEAARLLRQATENVSVRRSAPDAREGEHRPEARRPEPHGAVPGHMSSRATGTGPGEGGGAEAGGRDADQPTERLVPPPPSGAHLAIPGYDALSASQVVQRLAGLTPEELDAVASYEDATRGRRTILTRVAQLRAGPTAS